MTAFDDLHKAWTAIETTFMASPPLVRLQKRRIGIAHYASYLRETYFYTRENPQIQAVATAWFRGTEREMVKPFLRHALSEVGHDRLALADMDTLGWDTFNIATERPLPDTLALTSFAFYAIQHRSRLSYLGYLFFLEFLPTSRGGEIAAALAQAGVPPAAMTFLAEHRGADVHHNRLMRLYADSLLRTPADVDEVLYTMEVTGRLYSRMIEGAFEAADASRIATPVPIST